MFENGLDGLRYRFDSFFSDEEVLLTTDNCPKLKLQNWLDDKNEEEKLKTENIIHSLKIRYLSIQEIESNVSIQSVTVRTTPDDHKVIFAPFRSKK